MSTYADIETRSGLSQNIGNTLAEVGRGYADTAFVKYRIARDQRRIQQEDEQYKQKQAVEKQERRKTLVGAEIARFMADPNMTAKQRSDAVLGLAEQNFDVDIAGTPAGRMFLGGGVQSYSLDYYKGLGLDPGQSQQALERKHLGAEGTSFPGKMTDEESQIAEFMDAKIKAEEAGDTLKVSLINEKLSQMPRYKQLQDRVHGPTRDAWLSEMEAGGFTEFITDKTPKQTIKGTWGTWDKRYGPKAYAATLQKAMVKGGLLGLPAEQIAGAFNRWWDKEHKKQQTQRWQVYGDRSKFNPQETPSEAELLGGMSDMVASDATKDDIQIFQELEKKLPDIDLRSQYQANKAGFDKILSALRAGKTPDGKPFTIKDAMAFILANQ